MARRTAVLILLLSALAYGQSQTGTPPFGSFAGGPFEPAAGFQFSCQPPPETAAEVERPVAKTAQAVMLGLLRRLGQLQQREEGFLHDIFR